MADDTPVPLTPGSTIGILGGGQLGRMLATAAAELGFRIHVFVPDATSPASEVAAAHTRADYTDVEALKTFAAAVDVITYEFENVPAECAVLLAGLKPVRPGPLALDVAQDRVREKDFVRSLGIGTAPYAAAATADEARAAFKALGGKAAIVKTRRFGYDGKGQVRVTSADAAAEAVTQLATPCIVEGAIDFKGEISIVAARGIDGRIEAFDPVENHHKDGILHQTFAPSTISAGPGAEAWRIAGAILEALNYVGVIGVELFVMRDGSLLVNELAPRVHNSGHWTMDACNVSQFEQHIRAIAGWPLKPAVRFADCVMTNLIGPDVLNWKTYAAEPHAAIHLYGKRDARPGRKMGHVNRLYPLNGRP
ncbi:N5-carboxyaminoimidazole ribonucleotide synthase [Alphaproteobacteria bacterium SO-S41]|nr:N5-carboxyaminoimidazole ribonucleotide synthase [Alphaproteobacteria bacterium SO-S41]